MHQQETAMSAAIKSAGIDTNSVVLYNVALSLLRKNQLDPRRTVGQLTARLRDEGGILSALIAYNVVRDAALVYLEKIVADMSGQESSGGVRSDDGGDARGRCGPSGSVSPQGDGSVPNDGGQGRSAAGAPEISEDDGLRHPYDGRHSNGPSPSPNNGNAAVLGASDSRQAFGRVVPIPNKPRGIEALRAVQKHGGPSLFDTLMIRSRPIGDIVFGELNGIITTNKREAALLTLIRDHAQVHPATTKVRDVIKISDLQRMAKQAAEMSDA